MACAEAVWKHNVSVYRKNINTSSPLWVIDGGMGEGQPRAGRVTESQELARETDPMEMNLRGHRLGQVAPGTSDPPCASLPVLPPRRQPSPGIFPHTETLRVGKGGGKGSCRLCSMGEVGALGYGCTKCPILRVMQNLKQNCFCT